MRRLAHHPAPGEVPLLPRATFFRPCELRCHLTDECVTLRTATRWHKVTDQLAGGPPVRNVCQVQVSGRRPPSHPAAGRSSRPAPCPRWPPPAARPAAARPPARPPARPRSPPP